MNKPKKIICSNCILPSTFPGISFNEKGICNHCLKFRGHSANEEIRKKYEQKFVNLLKEQKKGPSYDVLMAYSGGKDSTYTLDMFASRYKLRVLALTFDNAFISKWSFPNIRNVCDALGVDSLIMRPDSNILKNIFRTAAKEELYSPKTIERASTICTSCIGLVKGIVLRTALEKEIPFVGFGWSPGQAPVQASVMKTNATLMKTTQKAIYEPLYKIAGDSINPYFVTDKQFAQPEQFPYNIHPLAFLDYNEEAIIARNNQLGWEKPDDTDPNSTNCLLNAYANHVHREKYGFHPYVWEIANMVRAGVMSRKEGRAKIEPPENEGMVNYAMEELEE